ncbi:hypothetical protein EC968_002018 [Mortierella alpina]|nr:hypothetical protein EC968_002018 [Mortierella alpina]
MRFVKSLLLSTAAVALLSMVAAQDVPETQSNDSVGEAGVSDVIVIESDPAGDDDGESNNNEASAAAVAADSATYNYKLCPLWGKTAMVVDEKFFCLFLPNQRGQPVHSALKDTFEAGPACTSQLSRVLGTDSLPYGFIKSSYVTKDPRRNWVQVTGKIDPKKYDFKKSDQGAAYRKCKKI